MTAGALRQSIAVGLLLAWTGSQSTVLGKLEAAAAGLQSARDGPAASGETSPATAGGAGTGSGNAIRVGAAAAAAACEIGTAGRAGSGIPVSTRAAAAGTAAETGPGERPARPFAALAPDGHAWAAMTDGEKLRYLEGFLAGQAMRQAAERLGNAPADPAALTRAVQDLRREGQLAYPFAPTVYKTRLEDFFFYRDRRDLPLHEALAAVNAQLRGGGR